MIIALISDPITQNVENGSDGRHSETEDDSPLDLNENSGVTSKVENDEELLIWYVPNKILNYIIFCNFKFFSKELIQTRWPWNGGMKLEWNTHRDIIV